MPSCDPVATRHRTVSHGSDGDFDEGDGDASGATDRWGYGGRHRGIWQQPEDVAAVTE
jgi:hypothetical protein